MDSHQISLGIPNSINLSRKNQTLAAIVCGFEHSGTTLVSEILRQHPQLDSGFEGGFLLNENPIDFLLNEPYCTNIKVGWGINEEQLKYICSAETWPDVYLRLKNIGSVIKDKNAWLFDKTPKYMQFLSSVLGKVPNIPCIVIVRDFRAVVWSSCKRIIKRNNLTLDEWYNTIFTKTCGHMLAYAEGYSRAIENGFGDRILLVKYENLCLNKAHETKRIFDFLRLEFDQSFLNFNEVRYRHVHGNSISNQYLTEYQQYLPNYILEDILKLTHNYQDWLWSGNVQNNDEKIMNLAHQQVTSKAVATLQKIVESYPQDFDAYINLGQALCRENRLAEAITVYEKARLIGPQRPGVYGFLGNVQLRTGDLEQAVENYRKAIALNPKLSKGMYNNFVEALKRQGKIDEAYAVYQQGEKWGVSPKSEITKLNSEQNSSYSSLESTQGRKVIEISQENPLAKYKGFFSDRFDEVIYGDYYTVTPNQLDNLTYKDISKERKPPHFQEAYTFKEFRTEAENNLLRGSLSQDQQFYRDNGFIIKEGLIPESYVDDYLELRHKLNLGDKEFPSVTEYCNHPEMLKIACYRPLTKLLRELHASEMGLIFTLTSFKTTQRGWHQDAYLDSENALPRVAVWIALGDIEYDSGPFEYVPKSHRWDALSNQKINGFLKEEYHWPENHRNSKKGVLPWGRLAEAFIDPIVHKKIESEGHEVKKFIAKKGDVLVWYGRLVHRGAPPKNRNIPRPTIIGHYAPIFERNRGLFLRESNGSYFLVPPRKYEAVGIL